MSEPGAGAAEPTDFALWVSELTPMEALRVGMVEARSTWLTSGDPKASRCGGSSGTTIRRSTGRGRADRWADGGSDRVRTLVVVL